MYILPQVGYFLSIYIGNISIAGQMLATYIDSNRASICPAIDILPIFIDRKSSYLWLN
jgi:hypothetical protein